MPRKPNAAPGPDLPCACATARRASRALTHLYDAHMRQSQLEASQFGLLSVLDATQGCNQAVIGRMLDLNKTTLSRNLQLLKRKGWIESSPADDARERRFVLSTAGKQRLEAAQPAWREAQDQLRSELTATEWEAMWKAFRAVTQAASRLREKLQQGKQ
jgi:DNA-binding MarR family transcriptional regulator